MPNKRSNRKKTQHFCCPYCPKRLWRQGSQKYHLIYSEASEIKHHLNISLKNASFLASSGKGYLDSNAWIEEFFCERHGKIWMLINKETNGTLAAVQAKDSDWRRTARTINPNIPNPSISEYSYRMSRGSYLGKVRM